MAKATKPHLPDGEFFMFCDRRGEREFLKQAPKNKDPDPKFTARVQELRLSYYNSLPESVRLHYARVCFDNPSFPLNADWVHRSTAYNSKIPRKLADFQRVFDFAESNHVYIVVSADWKAAIESLEPDLHEFFPHEMIFTDGAISDRYIMRTRQIANFLIGEPCTISYANGAWRRGFGNLSRSGPTSLYAAGKEDCPDFLRWRRQSPRYV